MTATITAEVVDGDLLVNEKVDLPNGTVQVTVVSAPNTETFIADFRARLSQVQETTVSRLTEVMERENYDPEEALKSWNEYCASPPSDDEPSAEWWDEFEKDLRANRPTFPVRF